jgi:hypothetical protein
MFAERQIGEPRNCKTRVMNTANTSLTRGENLTHYILIESRLLGKADRSNGSMEVLEQKI